MYTKIIGHVNQMILGGVIMCKANIVTGSFTKDMGVQNTYKSIISDQGKNMKSNIDRDMKSVIHYEAQNPDTIGAINEVQQLKADPNKKSYRSFAELLGDLDNE